MRAVNLLPADLRGSVKASAPVTSAPEAGGGSGAYIALGALGLCAVALAGYVLTTNEIKQSQADLDQLTARSAAITQEVNALKPYADFQATAQERIATVRDLASTRFDWEHALRDMARAIPSNVTVKKLSGSVSADAGSDSPLRGAITAPAITIDGCTRDQESVAVMMSRLRTVSGVTRVSLAKSSQARAAAETGAPAADAAAEAPRLLRQGQGHAARLPGRRLLRGRRRRDGRGHPGDAGRRARAAGRAVRDQAAVGLRGRERGRRQVRDRLDREGTRVMRSNKLFLGILVVAGLAAAYWFLLLAPKREEVACARPAGRAEAVGGQRRRGDARLLPEGARRVQGHLRPRDEPRQGGARRRRRALAGRPARLGLEVGQGQLPLDLRRGLERAVDRRRRHADDGPDAAARGDRRRPRPASRRCRSRSSSRATTATSRRSSPSSRSFVAVQDGRIDVKGRLMRVDTITLTPSPGNLKTGLQADVSASTFLVPPTEGVSGAPRRPPIRAVPPPLPPRPPPP